jgi:hypothetical protein
MTTARQVKKLLNSVVEHFEDLAVSGRWLIVKPVRHVAWGIVIDSTGEAARFRPFWAVVDLCEPREKFPLNWGQMFGHPTHKTHRLWFWDDPTIHDGLIEALQTRVLPLLRPIETLDDFVTFASSEERFRNAPFHSFLLGKVVVDAARGDLESARSICAELATGRTRWSMPLMREKFDRIMQSLCPLLTANDRNGLVRLLREWEAYSVKNLQLESVWEPTPFPLELQQR